MNTCYIFVSLFCVFTMVNCRFVLYDSDNSDINFETGTHSAAVKTIANILSRLNALDDVHRDASSQITRTMKCLDGWITYKDSCYFFDTKKLDFQSAQKECGKWEAHIVRLETQEENIFLKSFMSNHFKDSLYWIGMTDVETEGSWKISGTNKIVPFTDWKGTEHQNFGGNEDCAVFHYLNSYSWADITCSNKYLALCEKDSRSLR